MSVIPEMKSPTENPNGVTMGGQTVIGEVKLKQELKHVKLL
jgi:hypothetical protein